jgi:hypothetical protein
VSRTNSVGGFLKLDAFRIGSLSFVVMDVVSEDYHNPDSRSIGNAITLTLNDGTVIPEVEVRSLLAVAAHTCEVLTSSP